MELFLLWGASPYERSPKGGVNSEAQEDASPYERSPKGGANSEAQGGASPYKVSSAKKLRKPEGRKKWLQILLLDTIVNKCDNMLINVKYQSLGVI